MSQQKITAPKAIQKISGTSENEPHTPHKNQTSPQTTIAIIGHPYIIYDEHINHRLIYRLEQYHCKMLTPEMITPQERELATAKLGGKAHWTYEDEMIGAGEYYLQNRVDAIIGVMTFGCGPDSLMMDTVRQRAAQLGTTPFMTLTLEEHTAQAGIITRLEAFLDMIHRKQRGEVAACV